MSELQMGLLGIAFLFALLASSMRKPASLATMRMAWLRRIASLRA